MKYPIIILLLSLFVITPQSEDNPLPPNIHCTDGLMKQAIYESGQDIQSPIFEGLSDNFIIRVDTNNYASNFISFSEKLARYHSSLDTSDMYFIISIEGWYKLNEKQKLDKVANEKLRLIQQADSMHSYNNKSKQQVYIINNTKDTISIQMQDWYFMCILQAKAYNDKWYPIQYWSFSDCGLSYHLKHFPPETANSFVTELPDSGNFNTKLRYKLLGKDNFYYSNEFPGKINYCEFIADSSAYPGYAADIFLDSVISYWDY